MTEQEGFIAAIAERDSIIKNLTEKLFVLANERDAYAAAADSMAAAHKLERDELSRLYENALKREYALHEAAKLALSVIDSFYECDSECDCEGQKAIAALKAVLK